jgi:YHS domain-containing protein
MGLLGTLARYLLIGLAVWAMYRLLRGWLSGARRGMASPDMRSNPESIEVMVADPQCGIYLPQHEALKVTVGGQERYFCSEACRDAFLAAGREKDKAKTQAG